MSSCHNLSSCLLADIFLYRGMSIYFTVSSITLCPTHKCNIYVDSGVVAYEGTWN